jgi:hypothetical protein
MVLLDIEPTVEVYSSLMDAHVQVVATLSQDLYTTWAISAFCYPGYFSRLASKSSCAVVD